MKSFALSLLASIALSTLCAEAITIAYDPSKAGEVSMVKGVAAVLKARGEDVVEITDLKTIHSMTPDVLLTVGQSGFDLIKSDLGKGWIPTHMAHQLFGDHRAVASKTTAFFIPGYLENTSLQKEMLPHPKHVVWTNGVAYDITPEQVKEEFAKLTTPIGDAPFVVILGGDAENTDRTISLYTESEAKNLADFVAQQAKDRPIVVLNGPRTGKHDERKQEVKTRHRDGSIDPVTQAFMTEFKAKSPHVSVTLLDFQFGQPSPYKGILGTLLEKSGTVLVPGESNSMIQDMIALNLKDQTMIYRHGAMNELHHANVDYVKASEGFLVYDTHFVEEEKSTSSDQSSANPNVQIAEKLLELKANAKQL